MSHILFGLVFRKFYITPTYLYKPIYNASIINNKSITLFQKSITIFIKIRFSHTVSSLSLFPFCRNVNVNVLRAISLKFLKLINIKPELIFLAIHVCVCVFMCAHVTQLSNCRKAPFGKRKIQMETRKITYKIDI